MPKDVLGYQGFVDRGILVGFQVDERLIGDGFVSSDSYK